MAKDRYWLYRAYDADGKKHEGATVGKDHMTIILRFRQTEQLQIFYIKTITKAEYDRYLAIGKRIANLQAVTSEKDSRLVEEPETTPQFSQPSIPWLYFRYLVLPALIVMAVIVATIVILVSRS
jgi:hypothetical protein